MATITRPRKLGIEMPSWQFQMITFGIAALVGAIGGYALGHAIGFESGAKAGPAALLEE